MSGHIRHGVVYLVHEIVEQQDKLHDASVRTIGKVEHCDAQSQTCRIRDLYTDSILVVETAMLPVFPQRIGALNQFIGEMDTTSDSEPRLKARVSRNMDGLDAELFREALRIRRQFEQDLAS